MYKLLLRNECMRVRRNISVDQATADKLVELAEQSHRNVSQWITDKVWHEAKGIKSSGRSGKGLVK